MSTAGEAALDWSAEDREWVGREPVLTREQFDAYRRVLAARAAIPTDKELARAWGVSPHVLKRMRDKPPKRYT